MQNVEWGEYKLGDLFDIENTSSFNADRLVPGSDYDYVTRTSFNQGILQTTGFVNQENINPAGTWSLGLLQMDFFYRQKPWYAGQFVRKITPKFEVSPRAALYFSALLNKQKSTLLAVLVRNVDETFRDIKILLPITPQKTIDFDFIEAFVVALESQYLAELESERVTDLEAYLQATGLKDYTLTPAEEFALGVYSRQPFEDFSVLSLFDVNNTSNLLSRDIVENSGSIPYLCASADNNAVSSYIDYDRRYLNEGNCIFIGGKTFVVTYQEQAFFSNDSHNLALYLTDQERSKLKQLYLATCISKSLGHKYSWGDSISKAKIKNDLISLPVSNGHIDFTVMESFISAIQKLVIKDVVLYADKKIAAARAVVQANNR